MLEDLVLSRVFIERGQVGRQFPERGDEAFEAIERFILDIDDPGHQPQYVLKVVGERVRVQWGALGLVEVHRPENHSPEVGVEPLVPLLLALEQPLVHRPPEGPENESAVFDHSFDLGGKHSHGPGHQDPVDTPVQPVPALKCLGREDSQEPHRVVHLQPLGGMEQDLGMRLDDGHRAVRA